jgi:hypothetical protein
MNQRWVADITCIRLRIEFVCLAVVLDAFSRRVIGWALGRTLEAGLAVAALQMALLERKPPAGLVHHSDRGAVRFPGLHGDSETAQSRDQHESQGESVQVARYGVVSVATLHHSLQPRPDDCDGLMHHPAQLLLNHSELCPHPLCRRMPPDHKLAS